ncbi:MAG: amidohydrolase [Bacteroidota bacterium]
MRTFIFTLLLIFIFTQQTFSQMTEAADLIVINAKVHSFNLDFSEIEAFAVKNGRFAGIGSTKEILAKYHSTNILNAVGAHLYPGFIDAHCHFLGYAMSLRQIDLFGIDSWKKVLDILKERSEAFSDEWLVGRGWDHNLWEEKIFPDRTQLDILFPHRPVVLIRVDGHSLLANGEALKRAGIGLEALFLKGEVEVKNGRLTGILSENAADKMRNAIPAPLPATMTLLVKEAQANCFSVGLTTVADAGLEAGEVRLIDSLQKDNKLKMRIYGMLSPTEENIHSFVEKGIYRTDHLDIRSIKLYFDGSLGSRTALLKHSYQDDPSKQGLLVTNIDSVRKISGLAMKNGYQVNSHAIGDSAVKRVLLVYGEFLKAKNDLRWRIEHAQVVDPADISLFGKYSVIPSVQATHATSDMRWAGDRLGQERIRWAYAYRSLMLENGWIANGTDFPIENIRPLYTFYAAVARKDLKGWPPSGFQMENALSRGDALKSITIWAAKGCFEEKEKGSIEIGKFADFVILDRDILTVDEKDLPGTIVLKTFVGGEKVFEREK